MLRRSLVKEKEKPKAAKILKPGRPPKTPEMVAPAALRTLAEQLSVQRDSYEEVRSETASHEGQFLGAVLDALAPAANFLCTLTMKAIRPVRPKGEDFIVLVSRAYDAIVLRADGKLGLQERDAIHGFDTADEFVRYVGVGYAGEIAHACQRELKRAIARLPELVHELQSYRAQLPGAASEEVSDDAS